jgi:hypothetical protein
MATVIVLPDCALRLLERLYPTVDWNRVTFLSGLPFWVSSATSAITLPDPIDAWRFRIYLGSNTDFCQASDMATLVHEAMHIAQFMSVGNGYGPGFFRPAFIGYFACHFAHGYDANPYELQADEQEDRFNACYGKNPVCDCLTGTPVFDDAALAGLVACDERLVIRSPRAPMCPGLWWLLALPVVATLALLVFIVHWFDRVRCTLIRKQFTNCIQWGQTAQTTCQQWGQQTVEKCLQWADQSYERCDKWADEGYNQCSEWADQGYNSCCTWWPCSWGCKALVWISNIVCVATIWVTNMVCKVSVWVTSLVCILTALVTVLVCLVVTILIQLICLIWMVFWSLVLFCWI